MTVDYLISATTNLPSSSNNYRWEKTKFILTLFLWVKNWNVYPEFPQTDTYGSSPITRNVYRTVLSSTLGQLQLHHQTWELWFTNIFEASIPTHSGGDPDSRPTHTLLLEITKHERHDALTPIKVFHAYSAVCFLSSPKIRRVSLKSDPAPYIITVRLRSRVSGLQTSLVVTAWTKNDATEYAICHARFVMAFKYLTGWQNSMHSELTAVFHFQLIPVLKARSVRSFTRNRNCNTISAWAT